jgi:uncharacterized protein YggE
MLMRKSHIQIIATILAVVPGGAAAQAALKDAVPHITVVGHARMEVVPDLAILSLSVVTERPKADDAAAENARTAQALIADIKAQGIDASDIQTTSVALSPDHEEIGEGVSQTSKQVLRGYIARTSVAVRIHDLATAGTLARRMIDKGANQVDDISFGYEHEDEAYDKLRDAAMRDALRRAKDYLPAAEMYLGRVIEISPVEGTAEPRANLAFAAASAARTAEAPIPIEPGTLTLQTDVEVTWELSR